MEIINYELKTQNDVRRVTGVGEISSEDIEQLFNWAGSKLLALSVSRMKPNSYLNHWPEFKNDYFPHNFSTKPLLFTPPTAKEIDLIDSILELINFASDPISRRIIQSRSLVHPVNNKHLFSYSKIARLLTISPHTTQRKYARGILQIISQVKKEKILYFKEQIKN